MFYLNKIFKPSKKIDLQRIGDKFDGGYLINTKNISEANNFYSFGIGLSWKFESDVYELKRNQNKPFKIFMFDHSISNYFWFKSIIISFIELLRFKKRFFFYILKFFELKRFTNKKECVFKNYMVSPINLKHADIYKLKVTDINEIFEEKANIRDNFIKIDIEGSEYRILDQLLANQNYLTGCIVEFHDIDLHIKKITEFIENFDLNLIHCHVNNCGPIKDDKYPTQVEISFSYIDNDDKNILSHNFDLPHKLDMPNRAGLRDDKIVFF